MIRYGELILYKAVAELKAEAARTYLSFLWWVFDPLMNMAIFYIVFGVLLNRSEPDYVPFLLVGLTVWNGFANVIRHGAGSIPDNHQLMRQTYLPKWIFPLVVVVMDAVKFGIVFSLLLVFLWGYGCFPTVHYLALIPLTGLLFLLGSACTLIVAAVVPFVPDIRFLIDSFLNLMFFLSGVFFSAAAIPERYHIFFYWNPMAVLIESYRNVLMHARWPDWSLLFQVMLVAVVLTGMGIFLLRHWDRVYPKIVLR